MSSLWDVPQYLIMAFSLAFPAPAEKASKVALNSSSEQSHTRFAKLPSGAISDDVWLRTIKTAASASDILGGYAARVFVTSSGRYYVPAHEDRAEILALRANAEVVTRVMAAASRATAERIQQETGSMARASAVLVAHVAGYDTARAFAKALARDPTGRVGVAVPQLSSWIGARSSLSLAALDARLGAALGMHATIVAGPATPRGGLIRGTLTAPDTTAARAAFAQAH